MLISNFDKLLQMGISKPFDRNAAIPGVQSSRAEAIAAQPRIEREDKEYQEKRRLEKLEAGHECNRI